MSSRSQARPRRLLAAARPLPAFLIAVLTLLSLTAAGALTPLATAGPDASSGTSSRVGGRFTDCFWHNGAYGAHDINTAYPDADATYWGATFNRPAGSTLTLEGEFPHSRYFSLISYDLLGAAVDGLADYQIDPNSGATNPFRAGEHRDATDRAFTVNVVDKQNPGFTLNHHSTEAPRNVLYTKSNTAASNLPVVGGLIPEILLTRVYVPDAGLPLTGGVPLPQPKLVLKDGTVLTGQAACQALHSEDDRTATNLATGSLNLNLNTYRALRYPDKLNAPCNVLPGIAESLIAPGCPTIYTAPSALVQVPRQVPDTFPATYPAQWRSQYDRRYLLQLYTGDNAPGAESNPTRSGGGGFFPNVDNNYIRTALNRKFGKVVVLQGKLPTTPITFHGDNIMGSGQVRYTSFCMNESVYTTAVMDCAYDEQIPTDKDGNYTIVISRAEDRPADANAQHGVGWIEWSPRGDGDQDPDFGWLQIRHMLPDPDFANAVQNTRTPGDESTVMGPYLPSVTYFADGAAFDSWHSTN
ncbi:hypothetical protein [Nocardia sp. NPDC004123]